MVCLETKRLILRPFVEADLDAYARFCADAETMRYLGDGRPLARWEAWRQMALFLGHWQLRGYGLWAAQDRTTGALVGRIGLYNPEGWPGLEVGWLVDRALWGRGLATEGGRAALAYAFRELDADHVISIIRPENRASIRVAEKLGMVFERTEEVLGKESLIYGKARDLEVTPARPTSAAPIV
jgi:RimJ/RimL family protein N-acetyltransferase